MTSCQRRIWRGLATPPSGQAIQAMPDSPVYLNNRAAAYLMLNKYEQAANDATKATKLDPSFLKGYVRAAKAFLTLVYYHTNTHTNTYKHTPKSDRHRQAHTCIFLDANDVNVCTLKIKGKAFV